MNYTFNNIGFVKDASGNFTGATIYFSGTNATTGDTINGSVHVSLTDLSATGFDTAKITALIKPAVQAAVA